MKPTSLVAAIAAAALLAGCGSMSSGGKSAMSAPAATQTAAISMPDGPGRDWTKVDTNRDGSVSPTEMEAWLKANPGPAKK